MGANDEPRDVTLTVEWIGRLKSSDAHLRARAVVRNGGVKPLTVVGFRMEQPNLGSPYSAAEVFGDRLREPIPPGEEREYVSDVHVLDGQPERLDKVVKASVTFLDSHGPPMAQVVRAVQLVRPRRALVGGPATPHLAANAVPLRAGWGRLVGCPN